METTAANNGQKKKLALKITERCRRTRQAFNGADPAENQTPSYSAEVELEGNEVKPLAIFMLYYAVLAVFASETN